MYNVGDKLIVFKTLNLVAPKRKFKRIIQFGRIYSLSFKQIRKMKTKKVVQVASNKVVFDDGTSYPVFAVAKPGELKKKLEQLSVEHDPSLQSSYLCKLDRRCTS